MADTAGLVEDTIGFAEATLTNLPQFYRKFLGETPAGAAKAYVSKAVNESSDKTFVVSSRNDAVATINYGNKNDGLVQIFPLAYDNGTAYLASIHEASSTPVLSPVGFLRGNDLKEAAKLNEEAQNPTPIVPLPPSYIQVSTKGNKITATLVSGNTSSFEYPNGENFQSETIAIGNKSQLKAVYKAVENKIYENNEAVMRSVNEKLTNAGFETAINAKEALSKYHYSLQTKSDNMFSQSNGQYDFSSFAPNMSNKPNSSKMGYTADGGNTVHEVFGRDFDYSLPPIMQEQTVKETFVLTVEVGIINGGLGSPMPSPSPSPAISSPAVPVSQPPTSTPPASTDGEVGRDSLFKDQATETPPVTEPVVATVPKDTPNVVNKTTNVKNRGGDTNITNIGGDTNITKIGGDTNITKIGGDTNITKIGGDTNVKNVKNTTDSHDVATTTTNYYVTAPAIPNPAADGQTPNQKDAVLTAASQEVPVAGLVSGGTLANPNILGAGTSAEPAGKSSISATVGGQAAFVAPKSIMTQQPSLKPSPAGEACLSDTNELRETHVYNVGRNQITEESIAGTNGEAAISYKINGAVVNAEAKKMAHNIVNEIEGAKEKNPSSVKTRGVSGKCNDIKTESAIDLNKFTPAQRDEIMGIMGALNYAMTHQTEEKSATTPASATNPITVSYNGGVKGR